MKEQLVKELRIGNWTHKSLLDKSISRDYQIKAFDFKEWENATYKPIPLTEEWLKKFGFKDDNKEQRKRYTIAFTEIDWLLKGNTPESKFFRIYQETEKDKHTMNIRGYPLGEFRVYASGSFVLTVKYVHQLQNLYFALCSKELKLKKI